MTDETKTEVQTPDPNAKGLPPGVTVDQTNGDDRGAGAPQAPEVNNTPPPKEQTEEEKAKEEADKKAADEAAKETEEEDTDAEAKDEQKDEIPAEYPDYGNDTANAVVATLKDAGVTVEESHNLFKEAIESGDFSKVDMSKLTEKLGKAKADLVMLGVQNYYNEVTSTTKVTVEAVHKEVGGEANYAKIQAWAKSKYGKDADFTAKIDSFNAMFDLNTTAAVMAAKELRALYEKDGGNSSLTTKQVHGDMASTTANTRQEPLTREQYLEQVKAAHAKGDHAEVSRLQSQRQASRRK